MKAIFTAAVIVACHLLLARPSQAAGNDWMSSLNGTLPLSQYSIPGTHDTGARFEPFPGTAKCQDLTIAGQLDAGIRFLDIRCRHLDDGFTIHHGQFYQNINFTDVLNDTLSFLAANPRETVIMSVKEEYDASGNTRSFETTFDSYVAQNPSKWLLGATVPTLDAARGKIVLFRRFGASSTPKGIDASSFPDNTTFSTGGRLRVQDRYVVPDNNAKWAAIEAILNEARYGGPDTLYVNFTSGYKSGAFGIPSITTVSNNINPRISTFFNANPSGHFGTILMDFANASRAAQIYNTNAPAGRAVAHPAYFMIVNRNSCRAMDLIGGNADNSAPVNQWAYDYGGPNQRWALAPTENKDHFRITSWASGKCVCIVADSTAAGAKLHAYDYTGNNPGQQFDLIDAGNGYYKIQNVKSGLVLEIENSGRANNNRIQQNTDDGSTNQQWRLQPWGDYLIRAATEKYLCIENSGNSNGDFIVQYSWENSLWFDWRFESIANGYLKASSLNAPSRVIGVRDASTAAGAAAQLFDYNPENIGDQKLRIMAKTDGSFKFHFVHTNMAWDIPGGNGANLVPLEQYPDNGNVWQDFWLERLVVPGNPNGLFIPPVVLDLNESSVMISWPSQAGYVYQPYWSDDLLVWHKLVPAPLVGNGSMLVATDALMPNRNFYRVLVSKEP